MSDRQGPRHPVLAGALAGALEVLCTYPLEGVKTLLQVQSEKYGTCSLACARRVVAERGAAGLYRGLSPHLLFAFPRVGLRFGIFNALSERLRGGARRALAPGEVLLAGTASGFAEAALATVPLTTLSVRLCADGALAQPRFTSLPQAVALIAREEGAAGLYRGAGPTLLKCTIQIALRFALFSDLQLRLARAFDGASSTFVTLSAGGLAGAATVVMNHPLDSVKSRVQACAPGTYRNSLEALRAIIRDSGYGGLWAGFRPRLLRVVLETSLTFYFFENISTRLDASPFFRE